MTIFYYFLLVFKLDLNDYILSCVSMRYYALLSIYIYMHIGCYNICMQDKIIIRK